MTIEEKNRIFENIISTPNLSRQPIKSIWVNPFVLIIKRNHLAYYVVIPLIIILASGGVALASEESLPNSILYPIKVSVVEPIRGALTFSSKAKAEFESNLATERLVEAETLAGAGKLDQPTEKRLNKLLERHTASLNNALSKIDKIESTGRSIGQAEEIVTNFHANMNAHAQVLDILSRKEDNAQVWQNADIQISKTARDSADRITNISNSKEIKIENKVQNKLDNYKKRKEAVQSLIDKTTTELDSASTGLSSPNQEIIDNANDTLNKSKQFLNEADNHEKKGDQVDAYSTLLDSESSVKEADIFLHAGLKLKGENNESSNN